MYENFLAFVTSLILFRTLLNRNLWMNPLSDVYGRMGHLGNREWRTEADHRVPREHYHDGAVFKHSDVDVRRKDRKRLEKDPVAKRKDNIYLFSN